MLDHSLVLKADELFLVGEIETDGSGESGKGLYLRDTRHLSQFSVELCGHKLNLLSARAHDARSATAVLANPWMPEVDGAPLPKHIVMIREHIELGDRLCIAFEVRNFGLRALRLPITMEFAADFRDIFDIRGFARADRGRVRHPVVGDQTFTLGYDGRDGFAVETTFTLSQPATLSGRMTDVALPDGTSIDLGVVMAGFDPLLAAGEAWRLTVDIGPIPAGGTPLRHIQRDTRCAAVHTNHVVLNAIHHQATLDLMALETPFGHGTLPAAGIPWFVAPFGRDSLIVGLQTLHLHPESAARTLRFLAAHQGTKVDRYTDEEPGKILHEFRYGEMARLGEVPHVPYYGTVDATPLFAWLAAETCLWTCDDELYHAMSPHVRRAFEWIEQCGDVDGDGLVDYSTVTTGAGTISHKIWKDSWDSLHYPDGRPGIGMITPVEVQGYVYAGYRRWAKTAALHGDAAWATELAAKADAVQAEVERRFWLDGESCYAQALGPDKEPIGAVSSNSAQLLMTGLPSPERAARMARRFLGPDMLTGWGLRTLSESMTSFNPMSYHNGSIWPHDNSLAVAGAYAYGQNELGERIAEGLLEAAAIDPILRLPELYCGFRRDDAVNDAPVPYPVSCSPQAWASGALPLVVRAIAGLEADPASGSLLVKPNLPGWLDRIEFRDLRVLGQRGSLLIERLPGTHDGYQVTSQHLIINAI